MNECLPGGPEACPRDGGGLSNSASFALTCGSLVLFNFVLSPCLAGVFLRMPPVMGLLLGSVPMQLCLIGSAVIPAWLAVRGRGGLAQSLNLKIPSLRQVFGVCGLCLAMLPAVMGVEWGTGLILKLFGDAPAMHPVLKMCLQCGMKDFILLALMSVVLAPVAEELAFRDVIFSYCEKFLGSNPSAFISSAAFALAHGALAYIPPMLFSGLVLQYVRIRGGNLVLCMVLHGMYNSASMALLLLMRLGCLEVQPGAIFPQWGL